MKKLFALAVGALLVMGAGCTSSVNTTPTGASADLTVPTGTAGGGAAY